MSKQYFVFSTLSADHAYGECTIKPGGMIVAGRRVVISGGANVSDSKRLVTPQGVVTPISEEELAICRKDPAFGRHEKRGFIQVSEKSEDADRVASDSMETADKSSMLTPADFKPENVGDVEEKQTSKRGRK